MKNNLRIILAAGILSLSSLGVFADNNPGLTDRPSLFVENIDLEHEVNQTLSNYFPKRTFTTVAYEDNILLTGQVASKKQKLQVLDKVKALPDVKNVWNYLEVGKPVTSAQVAKDAYLTTAAKSRLLVNKNVNTNNIKVVTDNGVVYLLGQEAGSSVEVNGAIEGIKSIAGVQKVVNLIK